MMPRVIVDPDRARRGVRPPARRAGHTLPLVLAAAGLALIVSLPVVLDVAGVVAFWAGLVLLAAAGCVAVDRSGL